MFGEGEEDSYGSERSDTSENNDCSNTESSDDSHGMCIVGLVI